MNLKLVVVVMLAVLSFPSCAKKQRVAALEDHLRPTTVAPSPTATVDDVSTPEADDEYARLPIYFDYNSSDLRDDSRGELTRLATKLRRDPDLMLMIEGNTDDRGSTAYNIALGERRARAARDYLVRLGVDEQRVDLISYGEERPAAAGEGEEVWAANRRDEFVLSN